MRLGPWKAVLCEKRTFLEVSFVKDKEFDDSPEANTRGEHVERGLQLLKSSSEPDLNRSNSRICGRRFVVTFQPRLFLHDEESLDSSAATPTRTEQDCSFEGLDEQYQEVHHAPSMYGTRATRAAAERACKMQQYRTSPFDSKVATKDSNSAWSADVGLGWQADTQQVEPLQDSMRAHLIELNNEDPDRVFIVRKIHKLGAASRNVLVQHYSRYGEVVRIFVADSKVKAAVNSRNQPALRPGNLGFIVMSTRDAVRRILADGGDQCVGRNIIRVQKFQTKYD
jgi:hypothetical protein